MTLAVYLCITFQSVHVIENPIPYHMHAILVVLYQVYGAGNLATFKGVYGTVWDCEHIHIYTLKETHLGQKWTQTHTANVTQMHHIRSK